MDIHHAAVVGACNIVVANASVAADSIHRVVGVEASTLSIVELNWLHRDNQDTCSVALVVVAVVVVAGWMDSGVVVVVVADTWQPMQQQLEWMQLPLLLG